MKKLFLVSSFFMCMAVSSFASNNAYKLNDANIDELFASSEDVTLTTANDANLLLDVASTTAKGEITKGGYLVRAFFCGAFALHRSYMGNGGKALFWYYFCIPVVGGVTACVDFWWVVFDGDEAMNKYKDNSKFMVWLD